MRTIFGSFIVSLLCSVVTSSQALLSIGGAVGWIVGLLPLSAWLILLPLAYLDRNNDWY